MKPRKIPLFGAVSGLVTFATFVAMVYWLSANQSAQAPASGADTALIGKLWCLPSSAPAGTPIDLSCAIGLKADNGNYYALTGLPPGDRLPVIESRIKVYGMFTSTGAGGKYAITGTIKVSSYTEL